MYDIMPITKTYTKCSLVASASDMTDKLSVHGEVSVKYKMISGSGFLQYDRDQETMRKVLYFRCTVDRTLFTVSVNAPEITPDMTAEEKKQFLPAYLVSLNQPEDLQAEVGDYHIRSITYGRRYETEVSISYTNDQSYDRIAGGLEAKIGLGVLSVSAKVNVEMVEENKESEMKLGVASQAYGFIEPEALVFATEVDEEGRDPAQQIEAQIATNLEAFNALDDSIPSAQTSMTKADLFNLIGDAYPISYTIAENRPFYDVLEKLSAIEQKNMLRNLDEAYDILRELEDLYVDTESRAEALFENYHLLSGATPLSTTFLQYRQGLMESIMDLQKEVNEYLSQTPINLATSNVYNWARDHEVTKQLDTLSLDLLRTDLYSLMGMDDAPMDDDNPVGTTCLFNGIQATVDGERLKFAGRVVFGEEVVRHVLFDIDGQVVSLGFVDHSNDNAYITENDPHELVFVREDCTLLREGSTVWYKEARYTISGIGSAEHKTSDGYVNKEKLTNIRINLTPEDSTQTITVVLTDDEIADVTLRGAESSYGFTVDNQNRLMYSNGYVCDNGFGFNEAKMVCSDLGYSRLETFETDYDIPAKNAWGRPRVTMFDLDCPEFSMSVNDCASSTDIDNINWEVCSSKNGVKLICSNEDLSEADMQVEIESANGQGCILDESAGLYERIDTSKSCLGGANDEGEFVGVDRSVIIGEMCLKLFQNDVLQCVIPEGEHDLSDPSQSAAFCYYDFSSNYFPDEVELMNQGDYTISMVATQDSYLPAPSGEMIPVVAEFESDDGKVQTFTFDTMQEHVFTGDFRCGSQFQLRVAPSQIYDHGEVICRMVPIDGRLDDNGRGVVNGDIRASFECMYPPSMSPTYAPSTTLPSKFPSIAPSHYPSHNPTKAPTEYGSRCADAGGFLCTDTFGGVQKTDCYIPLKKVGGTHAEFEDLCNYHLHGATLAPFNQCSFQACEVAVGYTGRSEIGGGYGCRIADQTNIVCSDFNNCSPSTWNDQNTNKHGHGVCIHQVEERFFVEDGCASQDGTADDDIGSFYALTSEQYGVRCCSDSGVCDTFMNCETQAFTHSEAVAHCEAQGMRLCSRDEIQSRMCCGTGGSCDRYAVWTSSR